jgi:succinate dehydrogenase / fumarate reductase flavoprotein subunit
MQEKDITIGNANVKIITVNTVVIGTGASGFNTADRLWQYGQKDIILISENVNFGTSRNSGSDKQTYYKLSLSGEASDSVRHLAEILFSGRCVDGEHALCEAALSSQCFFRLLELGVPFPRNRYGEYIGYKTDHDPAERATSIGPYTSKKMTECLQSSVESKGIRILDKVLPIQIIKKDDEVAGLLCARLDCLEPSEPSFMAFNCRNIVFATGGPAAIYADSVYPRNQFGAHAVAFEAGVTGKNLTEWQFGLASIKPRWNVSGTYMQVLPRFVSTDKNGNDQREFLSDYYVDSSAMLSNVFLKGYQWPFDARKTTGGSSLIDLFVYEEIFTRERRVFLDYRTNPGNEDVDFSSLDDEAHIYLEKAGACFGTPFERLQKMNAPAVNFYKEHGVDLSSEMLEISLCAQHNNGGLSVDLWWQTNIPGVFSVAMLDYIN